MSYNMPDDCGECPDCGSPYWGYPDCTCITNRILKEHRMNKGQSRKMSFAESIFNVMIGYGVAILSQYLIFPLFGIYIPTSEHLLIGGLFTIISLIRSYFIRRLFNWYHLKAA